MPRAGAGRVARLVIRPGGRRSGTGPELGQALGLMPMIGAVPLITSPASAVSGWL
jgi:hypothetical protein